MLDISKTENTEPWGGGGEQNQKKNKKTNKTEVFKDVWIPYFYRHHYL